MRELIERFLGGGKKAQISYEEAKQLARSDNVEVRRRLAGRDDVKPEILYFLSDDPSSDVRQELAGNDQLPRQADLMLAKDKSQKVRETLAGKIARLAPGLTADEQDRVRQTAYEALEMLARDQATKVRQILSEALHDVADAPPAVIRQLARDVENVVAIPVLEFSPVLTDKDLMQLIQAAPMSERLGAIARRAHVSGTVSAALIETADVDAVTQLLSNPSAQIREETLDLIIEQAAKIDPWQKPLVTRPSLSKKAALRLAQVVADNLLETLVARKDLDTATAAAVRNVVRQRIKADSKQGKLLGTSTAQIAAKENALDDWGAALDETTNLCTEGEAVDRARALKDQGKLNETTVVDALNRNDRNLVVASLALLSNLEFKVVCKAFTNHSAKGIVAVTWKANLSPKLTYDLQRKVGRVKTPDVIRPTNDGGYGMEVSDLTWQIDFLKGMA